MMSAKLHKSSTSITSTITSDYGIDGISDLLNKLVGQVCLAEHAGEKAVVKESSQLPRSLEVCNLTRRKPLFPQQLYICGAAGGKLEAYQGCNITAAIWQESQGYRLRVFHDHAPDYSQSRVTQFFFLGICWHAAV